MWSGVSVVVGVVLVIAVLLALLGAVSYGVSDFVGGLASRRTTVWPVTIMACTGGFLGAAGVAAVVPGRPTAESTPSAWSSPRKAPGKNSPTTPTANASHARPWL